MRFFFTVFTLAYASANLYALARFRRAFGLRWRTILPFLPLFIPLVFAPPIVRLLERPGTMPAAVVAAWVGYTWLGMLFLFCCIHGAADLSLAVGRRVRNYPGTTRPLGTPDARKLFLGVVAATLAVTAYSFYEAADIRAEHVTIATDRLPPGRERIRIAQISDVHVGLLIQERELARIAQIVRAEAPDLLVATGDLVDAGFVATGKLPDILRALDPPLGKYAITGNHEYYAGLERSIVFIERSGFRLLRNEGVAVTEPLPATAASPPRTEGATAPEGERIGAGHPERAGRELLRIAGVDDEAGRRFGAGMVDPEPAMFEGARSPLFTLYLKHRPTVAPASLGKFDLQLSGHTHRGQLFPFRYVVARQFPRIAGLYDLEGGERLYTSRGTGTWGPRMRFLAPPEVTILDLVRKGEAEPATAPGP